MGHLINIFQTKEKKLYGFLWLIYALITFLAVINHEPNRDEAQVWLLVRDLDISSVYNELSAMGHPGLWYLILLPFAKLGFPYFSMLLIHWLIGIISAALLLTKANMSKSLKILFLFSYYMLFEYMVPARNYSLSILLLFLIATYYASRFTHPIRYALFVFLLFNATTISFGAAAALLLIYLLDGYALGKLKTAVYAIVLMSAGVIAFLFQMWPAMDEASRNVTVHASMLPDFSFNNFWVIVTGIQNAFIPVSSEFEELKVALFFSLCFIVLLITLLRYPSVLIFILVSGAWLFYIFSTKLSGSWRHEGFLLVYIIFSFWISSFYTEANTAIVKKISSWLELKSLERFFKSTLILCFIVTIVFGLKSIVKEYRYSYSGAEETADFIQQNHYELSEIACYPSWRASSLSPYIPSAKLWQIDRNAYGTYFSLDSVFYKHGNSLTEEEVIAGTKMKYPESSLLLVNTPLVRTNTPDYTARLLFENRKFIWGSSDERFYLYDILFRKD